MTSEEPFADRFAPLRHLGVRIQIIQPGMPIATPATVAAVARAGERIAALDRLLSVPEIVDELAQGFVDAMPD